MMRRISRDMLMFVIAAAGVSIVIYTTSAQRRVSSPAQRKPGATPFSVCSQNVDIASLLPGGANQDPDVAAINSFIDNTESNLIQQVSSATALDQYQQITLLGKLAIYDKTLSPAKNIACATCHVANAGFTGGCSVLNATVVAQPGGVSVTNAVSPAPNSRLSGRKPQSYAYAAFAPILHYNATQGDFYGGNFWDMRATGVRLSNQAAEQASACFVWKIPQGPYRSLVETIWGSQSFAIKCPAAIASVCAKPAPPPQNDPYPVHLSAHDRGLSNSTYDHITLSIASYEASSDVSPFSSKFDAWLAGKAQLTPREKRGYELFNGNAH